MKTKRYTYIALALIALTAFGGRATAQSLNDNGIFYHSFNSPWSYSINPALFPTNLSRYSTLPRTNVDLSLPFSYRDLDLHYDSERGATIFNLSDFLNLLYDRSLRFSANADVNLLGYGYRLGERFHLGIDIGMRNQSITTVPIELTKILTQGNMNENRHLELGTSMLTHNMSYAYASVGLGYTHPVLPLTIGARVNVLDGIQLASIDKITVDVLTSADTSTLTFVLDYMAHLGGILNIDPNNIGKTQFSFSFPHNFGFTVDLGAKFTLFDKLLISASLLDIGPGMKWNQHVKEIVPQNGPAHIDFDGFDVSRIRDTSYFRAVGDSLLQKLNFTTTEKEYWYAPPSRAYIGASYTLFNMLRVGYLFHGEWSNGWFRPSGSQGIFRFNNTLSLHFNLFDWLELGVANSYTYDGQKPNFFNPGLMVSLNPGKQVQLYAAVDYVSSMTLVDIRSAHVYFGMNIVAPKKDFDE